jgi:ankyrin repeat protein
VELLLDRKADVNATTDTGQTPLHLAAATGQPRYRAFSSNAAPIPTSKDKNGKTPLFYASRTSIR